MGCLGSLARHFVGKFIFALLICAIFMPLIYGIAGLYTWNVSRERISMSLRDYLRTQPRGRWVKLSDCWYEPADAVMAPVPLSFGGEAWFIPLRTGEFEKQAEIVMQVKSPATIAAIKLAKDKGVTAGVLRQRADVQGLVATDLTVNTKTTKAIAKLTDVKRGFAVLVEDERPRFWWPLAMTNLGAVALLLVVLFFLALRFTDVPKDKRPAYAGPPLSAAQSIEQTRAILGSARDGRVSQRFHCAPPSWIAADPLKGIYESKQLLLDHGRVVWASVVQANTLLFSAGPHDSPAAVVYSTDPYFDSDPEDLDLIASMLFDLKGSEESDPELKLFADTLADELKRDARLAVPRSLTGGREVFYTAIMVMRDHLPDRYLADTSFPLLILPEKTPWTMILPSHFWSPFWISVWRRGAQSDTAQLGATSRDTD